MFYQRIYAFLLRRLLGPYLTPESCSELHSSIEVALSEGRYVLKDIDLRGEKVAKLLGLVDKGVTVRRATVRRLCVNLSLRDSAVTASGDTASGGSQSNGTTRNSEEGSATASSLGDTPTVSSTIRRTARLGSAGGGVSLLATVELDGLEIDLEPALVVAANGGGDSASTKAPTGRISKNANATFDGYPNDSSGTGGGLLASYVDAALKSLRLTAELSNLRIRLLAGKSGGESIHINGSESKDNKKGGSWVGIQLCSVKYHDLTALEDTGTNPSNTKGSSPQAPVLRKEVEFSGLIFEVGFNDTADSNGISNGKNITSGRAVAKMAGRGDVKVVAHAMHVPDNALSTKKRQKMREKAEITRLTHNINFDMEESRFDVCLDMESLQCVAIVARALGEPMESSPASDDIVTHDAGGGEEDDYIDEDSDAKALSDMMRQYAEARHLARTQQIRGGLLLPSEDDGTEDGMLTFDTFFDANDHSFCAYRSMMEESSLSSERANSSEDSFVHTRISFGFFETTVRLLWGSSKSEYVALTVGEIKASSSQSTAETNASLAIAHVEIEDSFVQKYFEKNGRCRTMADVGNMLRFMEEEDPASAGIREECVGSGLDEGCVISSSPCLSLNFVQRKRADMSECSVDVSLHALEFTYRPSLSNIAESLQSLCGIFSHAEKDCSLNNVQSLRRLSSKSSPKKRRTIGSKSNETSDDSQVAFRCAVHLPYISVFLPIHSSDTKHDDLESLLGRCGYSSSYLSGCERPSIGITCYSVGIDVVKGDTKPDAIESNSGGESKESGCWTDVNVTSLSCQNVVVFAASPIRDKGITTVRIFDILALSSERAIDADSVVSIQYSRSQQNSISVESVGSTLSKAPKQAGSFPLVPPLSAVKAQQQFEAHEVDEIYKTGDAFRGSPNLPLARNNMTGSDPQYAMSSEANNCDSSVHIHVPELALDLNQTELFCLSRALGGINCQDDDDRENSPAEKSAASSDGCCDVDGSGVDDKGSTSFRRMAIYFSCNQASMSIHGDADVVRSEKANETETLSYVLILDKVKTHVIKTSTGDMRHVRFLLDDITLYEAKSLGGSIRTEGGIATNSCDAALRCSNIRGRSSRTPKTKAMVVCYRSKLSRPLSPETPVVMLDLINRSFANGDFDDEDDDDEREVHLSVYDLTYRFDPTFDPSHLASMMTCRNSERSPRQEEKSEHSECESNDGSSSLTNLFVTFSDCAIDYTSPFDFTRSSRSLLRISEVRASSNLVSPPGPFQAYKLSVGDVSLHLAATRFPYNAENALLSCAKSILDPQDMQLGAPKGGAFRINNKVPVDATLRRMKFIQIITLDSIDALVVVSNKVNIVSSSTSAQKESHPVQSRPNTTATLSLGEICLYACQDSFVALTDTVGELVLNYTTPSAGEIEELKASLARLNTTKDDSSDTNTSSLGSSSKAVVQGTPNSGNFNASMGKNLERSKASQECLTNAIESDLFATADSSAGRRSDDLPSSFDDLLVLAPDISSVVAIGEEDMGGDFKGTMSFTEDEDEWLAVDYEWIKDSNIPSGEEQAAKWFGAPPVSVGNAGFSRRAKSVHSNEVKILPQHIPIQSFSDPLCSGDMDAAKFAGMEVPPPVATRIIVKDASVNLRFFAGLDWPEMKQEKTIKKRQSEPKASNAAAFDKSSKPSDKKSVLLSELLQSDESDVTESSAKDAPAPIYTNLKPSDISPHRAFPARKSEGRKVDRFFQLTGQKLKLRVDSFEESQEHRLASCMDLSLHDMFLAETISGDKPVKIIGEWFNEVEHPRDTNDGLLMMKMVSMHPANQISADGKFMSDESRVAMDLLPLRFFVYQGALKFIRDFFSGPDIDDGETNVERLAESSLPSEGDNNNNGDDGILVSPTFFHSFKLRPCKLKIDYRPERVDTSALRDGSYIELVNLLPLEDMVLTLKPVEVRNRTGWGAVFGEVARCWIEDICATQMHKFLSRTNVLNPLSSVGAGVAELVMIPLDEYKHDGNVIRGIRDSTSALAGTVAYEALNTSSKVTRYAANKLSGAPRKKSLDSPCDTRMVVSLPSRPDEVPSNFVDVAGHAFDSLTAGLREANYKIIYIPYKEYQRSGPTKAAKSVIKGIPVAVRAPLGGASEALSYTLLGVRNQVRPDRMKEEKVSMRGLI